MRLSRRAATAVGFCTILLWAFLAALTAASGDVPPFELLALTFGIGGLAGVALWPLRPGAVRSLRQPWPVWLLGVGGLFGYHAAYFVALRHAPVVEASLINYLWPLLIVLFSSLLPGERLRWWHLVGCALALSGAALVVTRSQGLTLDGRYLFGDLMALAAAIIWGAYSVLSRRFAHVTSDAVTGFSLATAALATACHFAFEPTVWPSGWTQWAAIVALGLGPVGLAFYLWDIGVKHGDIQALGTASYAAPLLSTAILVAFGYTTLSPTLFAAAALITAGALLAAGPMLVRRKKRSAETTSRPR